MKIIGLTGGVGSGKTQILEYLNNKYGATICQTDALGKKLQKKGGQCYEDIVRYFGEEILDEKGELNREKLANIVFQNVEQLSVLNGIVHPAVKDEVRRIIAKEERKNTNLLIVESAILVEDHYEELCDELWYVDVKDEIRKKRLLYSRGYEPGKVDSIIAAQPSKEIYMQHCDRVIDNNGVFAETQMQLDQIIADL